MVDQRQDVVQSQAVGLVLVGGRDAGNKQREELVGIGDCAGADQVEAKVQR